MVDFGLCLLTMLAVLPLLVREITAVAFSSSAIRMAAWLTESAVLTANFASTLAE
jgi:hypothetical protein